MPSRSFIAGITAAVVGRFLLVQALVWKFGRDIERLNGGDHTALLAAYGDDFVLHFHEGDHRWAGEWRGRTGMDRFLQNFVRAHIQGEIRSAAISGPPWAMTLWVRFDDHADAPDGDRIYENKTTLVLRTRWGKIVEQRDFYADTAPIVALEQKLTELGVAPVPKPE